MNYNRELLLAHLQGCGHTRDVKDLAGRATGRTTVSVLEALASAMRHPGEVQSILPHEGEPNLVYNRRWKAGATRDIVHKLGLRGFEVWETPAGVAVKCDFAVAL
jgi:hypothetical protein